MSSKLGFLVIIFGHVSTVFSRDFGEIHNAGNDNIVAEYLQAMNLYSLLYLTGFVEGTKWISGLQ